jgi:7,8-dihydro-6-hydroxymethylpterin-pyrophosphokinase
MMHKRNFVLFPLFEIEKKWVHPLTKTNIKDLILSLSTNEIRSIKQI